MSDERSTQQGTSVVGVPAIRVLVAVATRLYRDGLNSMLGQHEGMDVVGSFSDVSRALTLVPQLRPEVVLIDVDMQGGFDAIGAILKIDEKCKIVALSVPDCNDSIIRCAEAGIAGFVTLDGSLDDLINAVQAARVGEFPCSPRLAARLVKRLARRSVRDVRPMDVTCLTERELQVIKLVERGLSNKAIANELCIGLPTVKNHVHNILEKLQVRRRTEAAAVWRDSVSSI